MNRKEFINDMDQKCKLVRTEFGLTQDRMATCLGISKKTLVEIEKGRSSLGWTGSVALASLFNQSTILQNAYGGDLYDILSALAFEKIHIKYPKTMGGKIWWKNIVMEKEYKIQQNIFLGHYRLLDNENRRICSSFELEIINNYIKENF